MIWPVDRLGPARAGKPGHMGALPSMGVPALDLVTRHRALRGDIEASEVRVPLKTRLENRHERPRPKPRNAEGR